MRRRLFSTWFLGLSLLSVGCGAITEPPDSAADEERTRAPLSVSVDGPERTVVDALAELPMTPSQRAKIEALAKAADARHAAGREAKRAVALTFADQVEAGRIDRAALEPKLAAVRAAMAAARDDDRAAIDALHDTLDHDQREDLIDAVESRMKERFRSAGPRQRLRALGDALGITDAQSDQIRALVKARVEASGGRPAMRERFARGKELFAAFVEDDFSADGALPERERDAGELSERVLSFAEDVLPILTPEQQKIAAREIRAHAEDLAP